jgi:hypothetical protein
MEQVLRVLLYPLTQRIVVIRCHEEHEQVDVLDLLLHFLRVLIYHLPPKSKSNQDGDDGDP